MPNSMPASKVIAAVRNAPGNRVKVACSDIDGVLRGKYIHKEKFYSAVDGGFGFCDVVFGWDMMDVTYDNTTMTGWHKGFPDAVARIDLGTFRTVPWDDGVPFFLGEFVHQVKGREAPLPICPRQVLKRVLKRAEKLGVMPMCGMEFEWFNFAETPYSWAQKKGVGPTPITPGMFGYSLLRANENREFFAALMADTEAFGIPIEGLHTETGPGVYEVAILFSEALESADRAILFKTAAKEIGARFGIMPSFMAKWNPQLPGCSGHIHQSLSDGKKNLFADAKGRNGMSRLFESYLAGQVAGLMELAPMYWPTINSYKRLVDGFWAPVKPTWGLDNRTASFRVIASSPKATRLETRCPGADMNPVSRRRRVHRGGTCGRREETEAHCQTHTRHEPGRRAHRAGAAHADRDDADLSRVEARARLVRRRVRRSFRRDPRVGVEAVARRRHRLGDETLLRNHLRSRSAASSPPTPRPIARSGCAVSPSIPMRSRRAMTRKPPSPFRKARTASRPTAATSCTARSSTARWSASWAGRAMRAPRTGMGSRSSACSWRPSIGVAAWAPRCSRISSPTSAATPASFSSSSRSPIQTMPRARSMSAPASARSASSRARSASMASSSTRIT